MTITVADADFVKLAAGELDAQKGKLYYVLLIIIMFSFLFWKIESQR